MSYKNFIKLELFSKYTPETTNTILVDITRTYISAYLDKLDYSDTPDIFLELFEWLNTNTPTHKFVERTDFVVWLDTKTMLFVSNETNYHPPQRQTLFQRRRTFLSFECIEHRIWFLMVWKDRFSI